MSYSQTLLKRNTKLARTYVATTGTPSKAIARQLDVTLMKSGWKLSPDVLKYLGSLDLTNAIEVGYDLLTNAKVILGDHVRHNPLFAKFPKDVPDTEHYWLTSMLTDVLDGTDTYGKTITSYEDMLLHHKELKFKPKIKFITLGEDLTTELKNLYLQLAESTVPLNPSDLELLQKLFKDGYATPCNVGTREAAAHINNLCLQYGGAVSFSTITDALRTLSVYSAGAADLQTPVKFKSPKRSQRKQVLIALNNLIKENPTRIEDAANRKELFKRMFERLHPGDFKDLTHVQDLVKYVTGATKITTSAAQIHLDLEFGSGSFSTAISLLKQKPGFLAKHVDVILRKGNAAAITELQAALTQCASKMSARVLFSLYQHLVNRTQKQGARLVLPKNGKSVTLPALAPLALDVVTPILTVLKAALISKIPQASISDNTILVNDDILEVALPLSEKNMSAGFSILPKGSKTQIPVHTGHVPTALRFFIYWHEKQERTDYDLSCILLKKDFSVAEQVSYTRLSGTNSCMIHSGDFTSAPSGASEFIDVNLNKLDPAVHYIVPSVNLYSGETFDVIQEAFFGYMLRPQKSGLPFEPKTVVAKSHLTGKGQVSHPLAFERQADGSFKALWTDLYLTGRSSLNAVENTSSSTSLLLQGIASRNFLKVSFLLDLMAERGWNIQTYSASTKYTEDVTYIGLESATNLTSTSKLIGVEQLKNLLPA